MIKPWYKKWWGILAIVLFLWPFFLTYWIWKRKWNLIVRLPIIIFFWLFLLAIIAAPSSSTSQKSLQEGYRAGQEANLNSNSPVSTPIPTPMSTKKATPSPVAVKQALTINPKPTRQDTVLDQLWQAADKVFSGRKGIDISYNPDSKTAILTYGKESEFFSESSMVEGFFGVFVQYGKRVFQIEGIDKLEVNVQTTFTDSFGKDNLEDAVTMDMDKEEFQKYNWDTLRFQPIYYQMQRSASALYINPAILSKVDLDKLKLKY